MSVIQAKRLLKTSVGPYGLGELIEGLPADEATLYVRKGWATTVAAEAPSAPATASDGDAPAVTPDDAVSPQDASDDDADSDASPDDKPTSFECVVEGCDYEGKSERLLRAHENRKHETSTD